MNSPQASRLFVSLAFVFLWITFAGSDSGVAAQTPAGPSKLYVYKGISIGLTADQVRAKLGDPKDKSKSQDLYVFSDEESAQFVYDSTGAVRAIVLTFSTRMDNAPTPQDVFGEAVPANEDGGISKMVRYPKAGYWISYNRIPGEDGIISVAIQKI
ncbi:MAG: hypothetical protein AB7F88_10935 [Pyrinomonadaceae bacterium]